MAIGCDQCAKTFRTQSGKEWHAQHIHSDLPIRPSSDEVNDDEFVETVECLIVEQINNLSSPSSALLDQRKAEVLAEVKRMIANSDQLLRAHIEQRIGERLQEATAIHQKPARTVEVADISPGFSTTLASCTMHPRHSGPRSLRSNSRTMTIATDEMVRDALEYCGYAVQPATRDLLQITDAPDSLPWLRDS